MTLLTDISAEALEAILSRPSVTHAVLSLWICGNRRLQSLLSRSVTVVELRDGRAGAFVQFPKILTYLRSLRSLTIRRFYYTLGNPERIESMVRKLSSTVQELVFEFRESAEIIQVHPGLPSWLDVDSSSDSIIPSAVPLDCYIWNLSELFPSLKSLTLAGKTKLNFSDLRYLPSTLQTLKTSIFYEGEDNFDLLPPGLTALDLILKLSPAFAGAVPNRFLNLPPNLTSLELWGAFNAWTVEGLENMPRTLTSIPLTMTAWSHRLTAALPPQINELNIFEFEENSNLEALLTFPNTLTILQLPYDPGWSLTRALLLNLPRTLTKLHVAQVDWTDIKQGDWPDLRDLFISGYTNVAWDVAMLNSLPRTLTDMSYQSSTPCELDILKNLDLPLLDTWASTTDQTRPTPFPFQDTLFSLELNDFRGDIEPVDEEDGPISYTLLTTLPKFLRDVHIKPGNFAISQLQYFPKTLWKLTFGRLFKDEVRDGKEVQEVDALKGLPPDLNSLTTYIDFRINDHSAFKHLPSTLQVLELEGEAQSPELLDHWHLPALNSIGLRLDKIDNNILSKFPKKIKSFYVVADVEDLTPDAITLMPPHITSTLDIGKDIQLGSIYTQYQRKRREGSIRM